MAIKVKQIKAELGALFRFKRKTELRRRLKAIKVTLKELNVYLRKKWARMVANRTRPRLLSLEPCQRGRSRLDEPCLGGHGEPVRGTRGRGRRRV